MFPATTLLFRSSSSTGTTSLFFAETKCALPLATQTEARSITKFGMTDATDDDPFEWAALKLVASLVTIEWKERALGRTGDEACLDWAMEIASKAREKIDLRALSVTVASSRATSAAGHQDEVLRSCC